MNIRVLFFIFFSLIEKVIVYYLAIEMCYLTTFPVLSVLSSVISSENGKSLHLCVIQKITHEYFSMLRTEPRALYTLGKCCTTELHPNLSKETILR
jgi:hypothetical protein